MLSRKILHSLLAFTFILNFEFIPTSLAFHTWLRPPFSTRIHDEITEVLMGNNINMSQGAFNAIVHHMAQQDHEDKPMFLDALNHFDDDKLTASARKLNDRLNEAVQIAGEDYTGKRNMDKFYHKLGEILHAAQDFYSHSNYLEKYLFDADNGNREPINGLGQIPIVGWSSDSFGWSLRSGFFRSSYSRSGYYFWGGSETNNENTVDIATCNSALTPVHFPDAPGMLMSPQKYCDFLDCAAEFVGDPEIFQSYQKALQFAMYNERAVLHFYLHKDYDGSAMGSVVHPGSGKNFYELAHDLAKRETIRIWEKLEQEIRAKHPNGANIITAIKGNTIPAQQSARRPIRRKTKGGMQYQKP